MCIKVTPIYVFTNKNSDVHIHVKICQTIGNYLSGNKMYRVAEHFYFPILPKFNISSDGNHLVLYFSHVRCLVSTLFHKTRFAQIISTLYYITNHMQQNIQQRPSLQRRTREKIATIKIKLMYIQISSLTDKCTLHSITYIFMYLMSCHVFNKLSQTLKLA